MAAAGLARSTYYYHQARFDRPDKHRRLKEQIAAVFDASRARYGYRRIRLALTTAGWAVSNKLVRKIMRQLGLKSKVRPRRKYNSHQGTPATIADNILDRQFTADAPNRKWVSDVTEFRVAGAKVYLSPVMGLFDRSIVSYTVGRSPSMELTSQSLAQALDLHGPDVGLMVHTDQGIQYLHSSWTGLIGDHGGVQSMSRKGNCFDNAVMENFFGHLKAEMYHGETFASIADFVAELDDYLQWYNTHRVQERLKGLAPMQHRNQALAAMTA